MIGEAEESDTSHCDDCDETNQCVCSECKIRKTLFDREPNLVDPSHGFSPPPREEWKDENNRDSVYFPICNPYIPLLKSCNPTPHRPNYQNKDDFNLRELNPRRGKQHATLSDAAQSPSGTRSSEVNTQAPWQNITANLRPSISWQEDETLQEGATSTNAKRKRKQRIATAGSVAKRECNRVNIPRKLHMSIQQSSSDQALMSPVQLTRTGRKVKRPFRYRD
jgi:hypothetical protein